MPLYEFKCDNGHITEHLCKDPSVIKECTVCNAEVKRNIASRFSPAFADSTSIKNNPDIYIGRDANQRWEHYENKFKHKQDVMQKNPGCDVVPDSSGGYVAVPKEKKPTSEE